MVINENDIVKCLNDFGIFNKIKKWDFLAHGPDHPVPYDVIRKIIFVELEDSKKLVIKFIKEAIFTSEIIEHQSAFSDLLRKNGIDTPYRFTKSGKYCIPFFKDGILMDVTLEEWIGEKIPHFTLDLYKEVGETLGKMHKIAIDDSRAIGFSLLYNEIICRDTSYERLWGKADHSFISATEYNKILDIYNKRLSIVKNIWTSLPRAAVQGDIYSCNNITVRDGRLSVFDFNLAGDEVLIGDILQCWFRTIFDIKIQDDLNGISLIELWRAFIGAYLKERPLTDIECKFFSDVYALLGVVYYTKLLAYYVLNNNKDKAEKEYSYLFELLQTQEILL